MYRGRTFNRSRTNLCGDFMDGEVYPVFQPPGKRRSKCRPTRAIQQKLNQRNAAKRLVRDIRMNFGEEDIFLHLTCRPGEEPESLEEAQRMVRNFLRRLKRLYKRQGVTLKYIYCIERGEKNGRFHCHTVLTGGVDRDAIEKAWGKGYANSERLQVEEDGLNALARYMVKGRIVYKTWVGSRNLTHPEPVVRDNAFTMDDVEEMREAIEGRNAHRHFEALYPGFELIDAGCTQNEVNRGWYIWFEMRRKRKPAGPKNERNRRRGGGRGVS